MKNIIPIILGILTSIIVWSVIIGFTNHKREEDINAIAQSVCLTSGYDNWYKVVENKDGTYKVWCYNKQWHVVTFEM